METKSSQLPVVDLSQSESNPKELADIVVSGLETVGFLFVDNVEGIDFEKLHACCKWFFGLPQDKKDSVMRKAYNQENTNIYRGYYSFLNVGESRYEGFEFGKDIDWTDKSVSPSNWYYETSVWPEEDGSCAFKEFMTDTYHRLHVAAMQILRLIAIGLGKDEKLFDSMFAEKPCSTFRLLHYAAWESNTPPACALSEDNKVVALHSHTDTHFITLLSTFDYKGLEVLSRDGKWMEIEPRQNSLVLNVGDVFESMMGGRFKATLHRVIDHGLDRYSVPFFLEPAFDSEITPGLLVGQQDKETVKYGPWLIDNWKNVKQFEEYKDLPDID